MPIYTFLPASLETEYIKEVKSLGNNMFKVKGNNWIFYHIDEIKDNLELRKRFKQEYGINDESINSIFNKTKSILKNKLDKNDNNYSKDVSTIVKNLNKIKGFFVPCTSLKDEYRDIYTYDGTVIESKNDKLPDDRELNIIRMDTSDSFYIDYIEEQINTLIKIKYNFIHYNGFPRVEHFDFKNHQGDVLNKDKLTNNDQLVLTFAEKYKENYNTHGIESPFKDNIIIIDEVHNFVREIINGSAPALIFYDWIIQGEDIKLVFLSGTPIINKPAEIAILFNMLRGSLLIFDFIINTTMDEIDLQTDLRNHFYKEKSSIEQINTSKKEGKMIVSFTKTKTNFESIMVEDIIKTIKYNNHDLDSFFNEIYDGLYSMFDKKEILPKKEELFKLSPYKDIKLGKSNVFEGMDRTFNRKQRLFEVVQGDDIIDLSLNENFIEYFLDDNYNISPKNKVLLRRMVLGLTSYYPIDRKSIKNMPQVVKPSQNPFIYKDYSIVKDINIVLCPMSPIQWVNYENEYTKEKLKRLNNLRKKDLYNDKQNSDYSIRTRQSCNITYDDDSFRKGGDNDELRIKAYERMSMNGNFSYDGNLSLYSPKFHKILENIDKFIEGDVPTGKILYYSDFRKDAGSDAFEQVLLNKGYEKYNHEKEDINSLISTKSKKKRYTFLTGEEDQDLRKFNKEAFNHDMNVRGEYIQIILISSAGAEGISLKCVRQVHIMEPFWNYIRIDQVFGRAIRMGSHIHKDLRENERNVEQYLYLSSLPEGDTVEELFKILKENNWTDFPDIHETDNIKKILLEKHKPIYKIITKILSMKKETGNRSVDQLLFDMMERKNIISSNIINIIKESSVDCIQNSRDDIQLNNKCLRFSEKLKNEDAHFPGIGSSALNNIDTKQFKSNFIRYIKPDTYVILAKKKEDDSDIYIYYKLEKVDDDIDVRYIRENGLQICEFDPIHQIFLYYEIKEHPLNQKLGSMFSIFQTIYKISPHTFKNIKNKNFPSIKQIKNDNYITGYILKYNITEKLYFSPISKSNIIKLYDMKEYKQNNYSLIDLNYILLRDKKLFRSID